MTNRWEWLEFRPSEEDRECARKWATEIKRVTNERNSRSNFNVAEEARAEEIGQMGEIMFNEYLIRTYTEDWEWLGGIGEPDFRILSKTIDVKTGQFKWPVENIQPGYRFFIAVQQMEKTAVDYYVHIQAGLDESIYYLIGYISRVAAEEYEVREGPNMVNPAHSIPFPDLKRIGLLVPEIRREREGQRW